MPMGAVYVGRPTRFGNPWSVADYWDAGYSGSLEVATAACVENFRAWLTQTRSSWSGDVPDKDQVQALPGVPATARPIPDISSLRGKDLACWCSLDKPCHADVLLELANQKDSNA